MNKQEFLVQLRKGLSGLPKEDIDERLTFYSEMIDDRIEDGIPEETAVSELGTVDELVSQIIAETPLTKLVKEKITPKKKLRVWEIILIVLGFPIWLPLLIAALAIVLSVYAVLWAVIIVLWAVFAAFAAASLANILSGVIFAVGVKGIVGIAMVGAGIVFAGLSVFMFFGCKAATKGILIITKKIAIRIKNCFVGKEKRNE